MNKKIYSFDIFDTCLIRTCGFPHNVFDLLAIEILGHDKPESWLAEFALIRTKGEEEARKKKAEEITLEDIYNECNFSGLTQIDNNQIAQKEIEIEKKVLVPVQSILNKILNLHQKNISVIYISDMYLPDFLLKEILEKNGFWKDGDQLYVSSTSGKTKNDGSLFDLIAKENNYSFKKWYHWGDNKYSDYIIPGKKGIKSHLVNHKFSNYEINLLNNGYFPGTDINQRFAGILKAIRYKIGESPEINLGCDIVIPTITSFVFKIMEDARKNQINKLFFLARDGYLPYKIAELLQPLYPDIKIEYLYTSRSALYFPGINSLEKKELIEILGNLTGKKILEVFVDKTNIDISEFLSSKQKNQIICSEKEGLTIIDKLYSSSKFINILSNEYQEQKQNVIAYFKQCGLAEKKQKNAIVDIRGTRKCHEIINKILKSEQFISVKGYYFDVTENRCSINSAGDYISTFYSERYKNNNMKGISGLYSVIEQYFCATGTLRTIKYKKNSQNIIEPVFEKASDNKHSQNICTQHIEIARIYIKHYIINKLHFHNDELNSLIYLNLCQFSLYPTRNDLIPLTKIQANNSKFDYAPIVANISTIQLLKKKTNNNSWLRGTFIYYIYNKFGEKTGKFILNKILHK